MSDETMTGLTGVELRLIGHDPSSCWCDLCVPPARLCTGCGDPACDTSRMCKGVAR